MMREDAIQRDEGFRAEAEGIDIYVFLPILAEAYPNNNELFEGRYS